MGYSEGQADYKTQDQDKDGMSKAREATLGMVCYGEGQAGSPRTTGEATPHVGNRKLDKHKDQGMPDPHHQVSVCPCRPCHLVVWYPKPSD